FVPIFIQFFLLFLFFLLENLVSMHVIRWPFSFLLIHFHRFPQLCILEFLERNFCLVKTIDEQRVNRLGTVGFETRRMAHDQF
ncbi:hypothetical protein PFISCL1PPCAC_24323, partial [Pristionchus fissidentatus]